MIDRDHNGGELLFHNHNEMPGETVHFLARVVQSLTQCENTLVPYFISAFNENNNNSNDDKCYRIHVHLIFNIQQEGREEEREK